MAYINTAPAAGLEATYNALLKYVKQYITSGNLKSKFDIFEREEVTKGAGIESNIILAATNVRPTEATARAAEHGTYTPKVFTLISTGRKPAQYAVTVNKDRLSLCVNDDEALRKYAAELTESLYQGWVNDKNAGVSQGLTSLVQVATTAATVDIAIGAGGQAYADALIAAIKTQVEDMREGVTGASYGNTEIGASRIAADTVAIVMSNATAAFLDTYGYAKAFNDEYLAAGDVERVTSSRIAENTIIVTDSRNIILHKRNEDFVDIPNSDGSHNLFYNVNYFMDIAGGEVDEAKIIGYPIKIIKGTEATEAANVSTLSTNAITKTTATTKAATAKTTATAKE